MIFSLNTFFFFTWGGCEIIALAKKENLHPCSQNNYILDMQPKLYDLQCMTKQVDGAKSGLFICEFSYVIAKHKVNTLEAHRKKRKVIT